MLRSMVLPAGMLAMAALIGCKGGGDSDEDTENPPVGCDDGAEVYPENAATGVYYRTAIEVTFSTLPAEGATITIEGVTGTQETRGNTVVFTPSAPLAPSTEYTATVSRDCGDSNWSFTTSDVGGATADNTGNTYALDLASGRFVKPEGVAALLQQYLTVDVLVNVASVSGSSIQMVGAVALADSDPPIQDTCAETIPFPPATFTNPFFQAGPSTTTIAVQGYEVTIDDLLIEGSFNPSGDALVGAVLSGSIDTRPLVPLLDPEGDDDAICAMAGAAGISCEACSDGSGNFCLSVYVDEIAAAKVAGTVDAQTKAEACLREECVADPTCAP